MEPIRQARAAQALGDVLTMLMTLATTGSPRYTRAMKTAVSIPDRLFSAAERRAKQLRISRSELYAKALQKYLAKQERNSVTAQLNRVYAHADDETDLTLDPFIARAQSKTIGKESW